MDRNKNIDNLRGLAMKKIQLNFLAIFSFIVFLITFFLEKKLGINTSQFANKYPPTILHLSYGIFSIIVIYQLSKKGVFDGVWLRKILEFFSVNSYSFFFIHAIVIFVFTSTRIVWRLNWFSFFVLIVLFSLAILFLYKKSRFFIDKIFASRIR